ncbi:hypothetical protein FBZ89_101240 [Nitrospirillum amazonense]|uniref:Uncharacterized protein n=1 Tax=Nitrospirillum amazonense TaxID=28077 RepID=A0A560FSK4_9PROT|nr:hypothetical protein [Nitrospirillum amazonense]TWB24614.1 hypothetical protein FBZ89_101240 [Nitrospirillum amazonense]
MPGSSTVRRLGARLGGFARADLARRVLLPLLAPLAALVLMLWPALLNGFPIVFFDTGGYIEAAAERELVEGRSLAYGLFLQAASLNWRTLWGPVVAQSLLTLWLLRLLCAGLAPSDGLPGGNGNGLGALGLVALLALGTGMAWYTSQLMPDIAIPLVVATLWLLAFRWDRLSWGTRLGAAAVGLVSLLSHMSGMALGAGLVAVLALMKAVGVLGRPRSWRALRLLPAAALVAGSVVTLPLLNGAVTGETRLTPGGPLFLFGSLLQQGQVRRLLDERCTEDPHAYALCSYRHRLPTTADEFLWAEDSPLMALGGWEGMEPEAARINMAVMRAYPLALALASLQAGMEQFFRVQTGDGLDEFHRSTREAVHQWLAPLEPTYLKADQQSEGPTPGMADLSNYLTVPLAYLALTALAALVPQAVRRRDGMALGALVFLWAALAGNALICGALSNPHDRYQNRLVWLVPVFVLALNTRLRQTEDEAEPAVRVPNALSLPTALLRRRAARPVLTSPLIDLGVPDGLAVEMAGGDLPAGNTAERAAAPQP